MREEKLQRFSISLPAYVVKDIEHLAEEQQRTRANMIRVALLDYIKKADRQIEPTPQQATK
jgi:metal-responsive CopG/Arc/MetJ family transcriptional regulator